MTKKQKKLLVRTLTGIVLLAAAFAVQKLTDMNKYIYLCLYIIPYAVTGADVLIKSVKNIIHGQVFDENFLMSVATIGAFAIGEYPEAVFVMVFYQVGELFSSLAVEKSRRSISSLMDIRPDSARVLRNGIEEEVLPEEVEIGEIILIKAGEKIPLDGIVTDGQSSVDTSALTGESVPADIKEGSEVISGCINLTGTVKVRVTKEFGESTVSKILGLVENSSMNKAKSENFITKFARVYTPAVVIGAAVLAIVPSVITHNVSDWVYRALIFLVVSCPCALVISVPLSFFGGIGGASRRGILVKGANYLEALADTKTVVFDKTGTLTDGSFSVTGIYPAEGIAEAELLNLTASAEYYSLHPIAQSVKAAADNIVIPEEANEKAGFGITAVINGKSYSAGNEKLMNSLGVKYKAMDESETCVYLAEGSRYLGLITLADMPKATSENAIINLRAAGVTKTVMLTGDRKNAAGVIGEKVGIDEVYAQLLPQDKVEKVAALCDNKGKKETVVFVGDGINDAPVLSRADVGIAMGALGSDAAIEAADVVLMDDNPEKIAVVIAIARKTLKIVRENVIFALAVKFAVLLFAAFGVANMWLGVLADVGVAVLAILNAMRTMKSSKKQ